MTRPGALQPLSGEPHACPYLTGRTACLEQYWASEVGEADFERLIESGFRHFGFYYFRPACPDVPGSTHCGACLPLRVPVASFRPSRSQRRVLRRGAELRVTLGPPVCDETRYALYLKHKERFRGRGSQPTGDHGAGDPVSREEFEGSFVVAPAWTREMDYYLGEQLVGVGYVDLTTRLASSIYYYFDPDFARLSLGTFSVLIEIATAARLGITYYYLGYAIAAAPAMRYKMEFRPNEILDGKRWIEFRDAAGQYRRDPALTCAGRVPIVGEG